MERLTELLHTRYITQDFETDLIRIMETRKDLDLTGCRFNPVCERVLRRYYDKVNMINSEDVLLNSILEHNCGVKDTCKPESVPLPLDIKCPGDVVELFRTIDKTKFYNLDNYWDAPETCNALVTALTLKYPSICFDLGDKAALVFDFMSNEWKKKAEYHDSYLILDGIAIYKVDHMMDELLLPDGRRMSDEQFLKSVVAIPSEVGSRVLFKNPEFEHIWVKCKRILCTEAKYEPRMIDYL